MLERFGLSRLEQFKHPAFPFLYTIKDQVAVCDCIAAITQKPYGLEVGFGIQPTRVFHVDNTLPWLVTESNPSTFDEFATLLTTHVWEGVDPSAVRQPVIALCMAADQSFQKQAQVLVYRNLDYRNMKMVARGDLQTGQRVLFIIDIHEDEWNNYADYLIRYGYDPRQIQRRLETLPSLINSRPYITAEYIPQYVLDVTK